MNKEERKNFKEYVFHRDGVPVVVLGTNRHRPFSKEALDEAIAKTIDFAVNLRKKWDDDDLFPPGWVFFTVDSDSELVRFLKKRAKGKTKIYKYKRVTGHKRIDRAGWSIELKLPIRDIVTLHSMRYNQRVYEKFQEELAFIYIKATVETLID